MQFDICSQLFPPNLHLLVLRNQKKKKKKKKVMETQKNPMFGTTNIYFKQIFLTPPVIKWAK